MNTIDVLKHGHLTVLQAIEALLDSAWETPGVCGVWSVKEIRADLTSFVHRLSHVLIRVHP